MIYIFIAPGPRITLTQTVVRTDVGTTLKIEPRVQYSGQPYFTWTKDDGPLPANVRVVGYILYVPSVTKENQGTYTLTLVDEYGTAKIQVNVIVDDKYQPPAQTAAPRTSNRIIVREDQDIELEAGQSTNIICQLKPRNSRVISTSSWFRGNRAQRERFPNNIRPNGERLQIVKVKPADAGQYTCTVSSSDGSQQNLVVNIRVRDQETQPPTAQILERETAVSVGEKFELTCRVSGRPEPSVQWLLDQSPVDGLDSVYARGDKLIVREARPELSGYYTCRATSPNGQSVTDSVYVRVNEPQTPPPYPEPRDDRDDQLLSLEITPSSANVAAGETVRFTCTILDKGDDLDPRQVDLGDIVRYEWRKQDGYLPGGSDVNNGVLTLYNLQEQDSGNYICEAEHLPTRFTTRAFASLNVERSGAVEQPEQPRPPQPPVEPEAPLQVVVSPKIADLVQGRTGEFTCEVQGGRPNSKITWKRIGETLEPERHIINGNKLFINNVQPTDRGYFACEADDGVESTLDYVRVDVESREAPQVEIYPKEDQLQIDFGGNAYAQCRVTAGTPTPTIEWRRSDGRPLSRNAIITQDGSLLQIQDAGSEEFGTYECIAKNDEGEASAQIRIESNGEQPRPQPEVEPEPQPDDEYERLAREREAMERERRLREEEENRRREEDENRRREEEAAREREREEVVDEGKPPNVIVQTGAVQAREGETVRLTCRTNSPRPYRIDWLSPQGDYLRADEDGSLEVPEVKDSDSGYYTCVIRNVYGDNRAQVQLAVESGGRQPAQPTQTQLKVVIEPKSRIVSEGGFVEFRCIVETNNRNEQPLIRWSRAGGAEMSEYHVISGNLLRIQNLQEKDGGRYQCTAQSSDGSINFDAAYLQISRRDPNSAFPVYIRVLETPTDSYEPTATFRYGVRVTAECVAQTNDVEEIKWSKVEGVSRATYDERDNANTLTIGALVPMDLGTYVCIAVRRDGLRAQNSIVFSRHSDHGNQFKYEVQGPSQPVEDQPEVEPEQPQQPQQPEQPEQPDQPHYGDDNGEHNTEPVVRIVGEKRVSAVEGGSAEIDCEITGASKAEWERHGGELPSNQQENYGKLHKLRLMNLRESDNGYYICNAENKFGRNRDYVYLEVTSGQNGNNDEEDRYQREQQEREQREREQREREERERAEHERNGHDSTPAIPAEPSSEAKHKPQVYIRSLSGGRQIAVGEELKLVCLVTGKFY